MITQPQYTEDSGEDSREKMKEKRKKNREEEQEKKGVREMRENRRLKKKKGSSRMRGYSSSEGDSSSTESSDDNDDDSNSTNSSSEDTDDETSSSGESSEDERRRKRRTNRYGECDGEGSKRRAKRRERRQAERRRPRDARAEKVLDLLDKWKLKFTVDKKENAENFINRLEDCRKTNRISSRDLLRALPGVIDLMAGQWLRTTRGDIEIWGQFKKAFRRKYVPELKKEDIWRELRMRTQVKGGRTFKHTYLISKQLSHTSANLHRLSDN